MLIVEVELFLDLYLSFRTILDSVLKWIFVHNLYKNGKLKPFWVKFNFAHTFFNVLAFYSNSRCHFCPRQFSKCIKKTSVIVWDGFYKIDGLKFFLIDIDVHLLTTTLLYLYLCTSIEHSVNLKMFGSGWRECVSNEFNFIFIVLSEQKIVSSILWKRHFLKETLSDIAQINSIQISLRCMYFIFIASVVG